MNIIGTWHDLTLATSTAEDMVKSYGMSDVMGCSLRVYEGNEAKESEEVRSNLNAEINGLLNESYSRVTKILTEHNEELDLIATALLLKKTLFADEIKNLIEDHTSKIKIVGENNNMDSKENDNSEQTFDLLDENRG